jgi:hypothetical protein
MRCNQRCTICIICVKRHISNSSFHECRDCNNVDIVNLLTRKYLRVRLLTFNDIFTSESSRAFSIARAVELLSTLSRNLSINVAIRFRICLMWILHMLTAQRNEKILETLMIRKSHTAILSAGLTLLTGLFVVSAARAEPQDPQPESPPVEQQAQEQEPDLATPILSKLSPEAQQLISHGPNNTFSFSFSGGDEGDNEAVRKEIDQALDKLSSQKLLMESQKQTAAVCLGPLCGNNFKRRNATMNVRDSYIEVSDDLRFEGEALDQFKVKATMWGHQFSRWVGRNPDTADFVIVGTTVTVDGPSISLSFPPSMSFAGSENKVSYTSQPWLHNNSAGFNYSIVAIGNYGITGLHQADTGLFRFGDMDYLLASYVNFPEPGE